MRAIWKITMSTVGDELPIESTHWREGAEDMVDMVKFRMRDDDGELCYEGVGNCLTAGEGFEPLDDFGMPNAGCTSIEWFVQGRWEVL